MDIVKAIKESINKKIDEKKLERQTYRDEYMKHKIKMIRIKARRDAEGKKEETAKVNMREYWFG